MPSSRPATQRRASSATLPSPPTHIRTPPPTHTPAPPRPDLLFLPGRQTYVFEPTGKCVLSFNSQLEAEKHVEEALKAVKSVSVKA